MYAAAIYFYSPEIYAHLCYCQKRLKEILQQSFSFPWRMSIKRNCIMQATESRLSAKCVSMHNVSLRQVFDDRKCLLANNREDNNSIPKHDVGQQSV